ncbi:MAG: type IV pilus secretin PilQ [Bdellovibrionota bacterium]
MTKLKMTVGLLAIALALTSKANAGQVNKVDYTPGKEVSLLVINYTGSGGFRFFQSEQQGKVIVEGDNLQLPAALTRTIDASAKDGPVMQITPYSSSSADGKKQVAKFVVQLRQKVETKVSEMPGRFVLEIRKKNLLGANGKLDRKDEFKIHSASTDKGDEIAKKLVEVLNAAPGEKVFFGSRVTFEASNADVHDVFRLVGESSGLNIVTDSDVKFTSNYSLKDIPWDQLLDVVLQQGALKALISGNVIQVIPMEKYNKDQEAKLKQIALGDELEPVIMAVIPLSFAKAEDMSKMIDALLFKKDAPDAKDAAVQAAQAKADQAYAQGAAAAGGAKGLGGVDTPMTKLVQDFIRGKVEVDSRSNSLVVTNTKDALERIRRLVKELDVPLPQVLIDAKIVIASEGFNKNLGVDWGGKLTSLGTGRAGIGAGFNGRSTTLGAADTDAGSPAFTIAGPQGGLAAGFQLGAGKHGNLTAQLQLAESNNLSKTVASPRIIVNNKVTAKITDGVTAFLTTAAGANSAGALQQVKAVLNLQVTPQVTSSGSILLNVDLTKDTPATNDLTTNPNIDTKNITTEVLVDNGATLVLGGVYQFDGRKSEAGIPLLKELPFIGQLFRRNIDQTQKSELLVFITPQIIAPSGFSEPVTQ